jgi:hypothetical protein
MRCFRNFGRSLVAIPEPANPPVPQEIMLLNDTLRTNIVLGRPCDETRLRNAVSKAAIGEFIEALPERFDTTVGERGLRGGLTLPWVNSRWILMRLAAVSPPRLTRDRTAPQAPWQGDLQNGAHYQPRQAPQAASYRGSQTSS